MTKISRSMRFFFKGEKNSPLLQFSSFSEDKSDSGDGGGILVFTSLSISSHEKLAGELVQMFILALCLNRLLVLEFLSISCDDSQLNQLKWSDELYPGEFNHLSNCNLYSEETYEPAHHRSKGRKCDMVNLKFDSKPNAEVLQVSTFMIPLLWPKRGKPNSQSIFPNSSFRDIFRLASAGEKEILRQGGYSRANKCCQCLTPVLQHER